ncbi:peptide chain release factor N(5)-glutamine methyltransferase [Actinomyces gaoshouyii]|uniref:peptide chain release factor N(5)-glutamine methyltransferase n=1 Tax=Actinomyces gaoshouyii TaxID=1960083 RepID=UPI0009C0CEC2|nr:peptide chain release factor N(5)-glutamine methyltransferase [Actinomyces gaoshouyii]ARD41316.1 protein-(glutamine-N5) methyltransferase, release factor-specific [Actinomyces gaoshouyii]
MDRFALRRLVREAGRRLEEAGVSSPEHDARLLAEHVVGTSLVMCEGADGEQVAHYLSLIGQRAERVPLQHLTGVMWFRGLELECRPGVFIVRPETEVVAGAAIEAARHMSADGVAAPLVVDLCTGSGAIALAVAAEVPRSRVVAVEVADDAVDLARDNCERHAPGRVRLVQADAAAPTTLAELDGQVDVVVSNPPYVPDGALEDAETADHDPHRALFGGGGDGLALPTALVRRAVALLRPAGVLVMEHDAGQGAALRAAALGAGFTEAVTGQDLAGRDRYLRAVTERASRA